MEVVGGASRFLSGVTELPVSDGDRRLLSLKYSARLGGIGAWRCAAHLWELGREGGKL